MMAGLAAVGTVVPDLRVTVTQAMIDGYARASGDFNPIHVDPEFARTGPYGRTIAHGLMTLAFVARMLNAWTSGGFDESGELDIAFVGPVNAGDEVVIGGTVEAIIERDGADVLQIRLNCVAGDRQIIVGRALQRVISAGSVL